MYRIILFLFLSFWLTGCFDVVEHIIVKPNGAAELRISLTLDSGFVRMMSMADFDDSVRSLASFGDTIHQQFTKVKQKFNGKKGIQSYDVSHTFRPDSTLIVTTSIGIDNVQLVPTYHSLFWDIDAKEKSNDPTAFPVQLAIGKGKKNEYEFSFMPRVAVIKNTKKITKNDTSNIGALAGRTLEIQVSAPQVTTKEQNTDTKTAVWKLPLRDLLLKNTKVMKGSAKLNLKPE